MKIYTTATRLRAALLCAGDKDIRYYLNGVLVEASRTETRVVGCDGHRAAVLRQVAENELLAENAEFIIPRATVALLKPSKKPLEDVVAITLTGAGAFVLEHGPCGYEFTPIDGKFPDYRRIVPVKASGEAAQINPEYLGDFGKIAKLLGCKNTGGLVVAHSGSDAATVTISGHPDFVGVVMPYRSCEPESTSWAKQPVYMAAAA